MSAELHHDKHDDELPLAASGPHPIADRPACRCLMQVLWPAFLMAIVAVGLFFSAVDPQELTIVGIHLADSREAAYTVGFLLFWVLFAISNWLTWWLVTGSTPPPRQPGD